MERIGLEAEAVWGLRLEVLVLFILCFKFGVDMDEDILDVLLLAGVEAPAVMGRRPPEECCCCWCS